METDRSRGRSALGFLSRAQQPDGSFPTDIEGQPGVTGLCVMAFLAGDISRGIGRYGSAIERAIDYVLTMQDPRVGALMSDQWVPPNFDSVRRASDGRPGSYAGNYNHGIAGVMLAEVYGMTTANRHERIRQAVLKALEYTRRQQIRPKQDPDERGGWRYVHLRPGNDSDLSVTAWQLMFLRSVAMLSSTSRQPGSRRRWDTSTGRSTWRKRGSCTPCTATSAIAAAGWSVRELSAWRWEASTRPRRPGSPGTGSSNDHSSRTKTSRIKKTVTTTAPSTAARRCSSSAANIGSNSFRNC